MMYNKYDCIYRCKNIFTYKIFCNNYKVYPFSYWQSIASDKNQKLKSY